MSIYRAKYSYLFYHIISDQPRPKSKSNLCWLGECWLPNSWYLHGLCDGCVDHTTRLHGATPRSIVPVRLGKPVVWLCPIVWKCRNCHGDIRTCRYWTFNRYVSFIIISCLSVQIRITANGM